MNVIDVLCERNHECVEHGQAFIKGSLVNNDFLGNITVLAHVGYHRHKELFLLRIQLNTGNEVPELPDGFFPVKNLLQRITRAFRSTATNRNRLTIAKIISSIPCHVVNRNEKSPLVTATCPVLLINSLEMSEKHDIRICRAREEII